MGKNIALFEEVGKRFIITFLQKEIFSLYKHVLILF